MHETVNLAPYGLRRFESCPVHSISARIRRMSWLLPFAFLIIFELIADVLAKQWSLHKGYALAAGALLGYLIGNSFWLFALKNGSGLARGSVLFSVASGIMALILGVVLYKEELTRIQITGLVLGLISIGLIFWND